MNITAQIEEIAALAVKCWQIVDESAADYALQSESGKAHWRDLVRDTASAIDAGRESFGSGPEKACHEAIVYVTQYRRAVQVSGDEVDALSVKEQNAAIPVEVGSTPVAAEKPKRGSGKK